MKVFLILSMSSFLGGNVIEAVAYTIVTTAGISIICAVCLVSPYEVIRVLLISLARTLLLSLTSRIRGLPYIF